MRSFSVWPAARPAALLGLNRGSRRAVSDGARKFNKPPSASILPRPAGISSMFRLPVYTSSKGKRKR